MQQFYTDFRGGKNRLSLPCCGEYTIKISPNASTSIKVLGGKVNVELTDNSIIGLRGSAQALSATVHDKARLTAWGLVADDVYLLSSSTEEIEIYAKKTD